MNPSNENILSKKEKHKIKIKREASRRYYWKKKRLLEKEKEEEEKEPIKKKKIGRPKKRGPKKRRNRRKITKNYKERPTVNFKIISVLNGKQNGFINYYSTYEEANDALEKLEKENDGIVFSRETINGPIIKESKDEYLLLEKNRDGDKDSTRLRDEYGKLIRQIITNNDKWVIRNKCPKKVEETFWVYGFDPKLDRKSFMWIYNYIKDEKIKENYDIIRTILYKNKIIFLDDYNTPDIVFCKNESDAIRFYNLFKEMVEKNKSKQIFFLGCYNSISERRKDLEKILIEYTGWTKTKIQYNHT